MSFGSRLRAVIAGALALSAAAVAASVDRDELVILARDGEHAFSVEIADEPAERERGLMFRQALGAREGMLFEFPEPRPVAFWMKNTYLPLDMLFIAADGTIVGIVERTEPLSEIPIGSGVPVTGVLEVEGGTAAALGIAVGDRVRHPFFAAGAR